MKRPALLAGLIALSCTACLELVRRPPAAPALPALAGAAARDSSAVAAAGEGNSGPPADVQKPTEAEAGRSLARRAIERGGDERRIVEQVNGYALWCIDNGLWNEARSHLERALAQDSLAASLHNNLAIVYEYLGQTEEAAHHYERALALKPDKKAYRINLQRLRQRLRAFEDTSGTLSIFRLDQPSRRRRQREGAPTPALTGE